MIDLAIITARGGSVGLPGKNIRLLGGVPLIAWTVRAALASSRFLRVVVDTDDEGIAAAGKAFGAEVPYLRPACLATSAASSADVVRHCLDRLAVDRDFALLQPTSPFRCARHLREAVDQYRQSGAPSVIGVTSGKPVEWALTIGEGGVLSSAVDRATEVARRQDATPVVMPNGALYVTSSAKFRDGGSFRPTGTVGYLMGMIDSIDIDTAEDFAVAEAVVATRLRSIDGC